MHRGNLEVVSDHSCLLGEGPVWDAANKRILWVDILQCEVHQFSPGKNEHKIVKTDGMIGAIDV